MKRLSIIALLLFCLKVYSQNGADILSKIKNKDLKTQISKQEKITTEILKIFDADKNAEKYIAEISHKEALKFRKEQNLAESSPVQISRPRLSNADSIKLNLYNQDALLLEKYEQYCKAYQYVDKLSKSDKLLRQEFYDQSFKLIDEKYNQFYQNKRRDKTKFEKAALYTTNFRIPKLLRCEGQETDASKCFSSIFRTEIENKYQVPEFVYYDNFSGIKSKVLFRIDKEGTYEALEIAETSNKYFLDMNALQIAKSLFNNKKIAQSQDEDYYSKIPLTFAFDDSFRIN